MNNEERRGIRSGARSEEIPRAPRRQPRPTPDNPPINSPTVPRNPPPIPNKEDCPRGTSEFVAFIYIILLLISCYLSIAYTLSCNHKFTSVMIFFNALSGIIIGIICIYTCFAPYSMYPKCKKRLKYSLLLKIGIFMGTAGTLLAVYFMDENKKHREYVIGFIVILLLEIISILLTVYPIYFYLYPANVVPSIPRESPRRGVEVDLNNTGEELVRDTRGVSQGVNHGVSHGHGPGPGGDGGGGGHNEMGRVNQVILNADYYPKTPNPPTTNKRRQQKYGRILIPFPTLRGGGGQLMSGSEHSEWVKNSTARRDKGAVLGKHRVILGSKSHKEKSIPPPGPPAPSKKDLRSEEVTNNIEGAENTRNTANIGDLGEDYLDEDFVVDEEMIERQMRAINRLTEQGGGGSSASMESQSFGSSLSLASAHPGVHCGDKGIEGVITEESKTQLVEEESKGDGDNHILSVSSSLLCDSVINVPQGSLEPGGVHDHQMEENLPGMNYTQ